MLRRALLVMAIAGIYVWTVRQRKSGTLSGVTGARSPAEAGTATGGGVDTVAATAAGSPAT